ncbi:glycoside hydrolase family 43 protein [Arachidicoccus terrestris]|uniref:glycoside hydrolase family 43 protein n=1 Tax=Arachidicoccus terrestris TaxID=2875539 RepID=UPI001CC69271|nr:glycoside hydrolase family 43 protein [Arachidicoccus terrestris]UAY56621.1 glycoside hydrolase family 43 protein [Arachidicoccus terrestris]
MFFKLTLLRKLKYSSLAGIAALLWLLSGQMNALFAQTTKGYGYLYCHMSQKGEYTAYALSRDGIHFQELLDGDPVYDPARLSRIEGGSRDAFIARAGKGNGYVMVVTDMSNHKSHSWHNYGIDLLKSDDLINWSSVSFDFRKGPGIFCDSDSPDFYKDYGAICRVWAPQIIWDARYQWPDGQKGGYMIYYSLLNAKEDRYDRIFYSYADASFTKLTKPRLLIDWGYATIDADIHYIAADRKYHLLIKKEGGTPGIFTSTSGKLTGPYHLPDDKDYINFESSRKVEGPSAFQRIGDSTWRIAYVEYSSRPTKYRLCEADEFMHNFHTPEDIGGDVAGTAQHGSFLVLTKKEYKRLAHWSAVYLKRKKGGSKMR